MTRILLAPRPRATQCARGGEFSLARTLSRYIELLESAR